jgi:choline dehydrogenase-like flavoprotein
VAVRDDQQLVEIGASRVIVCAGAYGSPAILLRSGIGPAGEVAAIGVKPALDLPGVGRNLHDQPCVEVWYEGSAELTGRMELHQAETGWQPPSTPPQTPDIRMTTAIPATQVLVDLLTDLFWVRLPGRPDA